MTTITPCMPKAWQDIVGHTYEGPLQRVETLRAQGKRIHPAAEHVFYALQCITPDSVRVIILGQDPYHGTFQGHSQAHGLAFSVRAPCPAPPSLRNIFKEIQRDIYGDVPTGPPNTDLSRWARQGILLLNTIWTVEESADTSSAASHKALGWQGVTHILLESLANHRPLAVLLWGKHAQAFAPMFREGAHLVLMAAHPSPLSASRGFHGCGHFSRVNAWLEGRGEEGIVW